MSEYQIGKELKELELRIYNVEQVLNKLLKPKQEDEEKKPAQQ